MLEGDVDSDGLDGPGRYGRGHAGHRLDGPVVAIIGDGNTATRGYERVVLLALLLGEAEIRHQQGSTDCN